MFEHVVLRRKEHGAPISAGEIIEALLYYQKVHLVVDSGTLCGLLAQIGPGNVLALLRRTDVSAVYCEEMLGIFTDQIGVLQVHTPVAFAFQGHQDVGPLKTSEERLAYHIKDIMPDRKMSRRFVKSFFENVPIRKFSGDHFVERGVPEAAKKDILDGDYIKKAIRKIVLQTPGGYDLGVDFKFDVINTDIGFYVFHDINLENINLRRSKLIPIFEDFTIAQILRDILDARADLTLASFYGGDLVTSDAVSAVIKVRHEEILRRSSINLEARNQFIEIVLPDSPTLTEVIDSGERSFKDAMILIDHAARFKEWIRSVNPDEGLIASYIKEVSSEGWVQRLPAKTLRYFFALALDCVHPVAGLAAGFADNFIIDKLLGGWKPNHFVSNKLRPFIKNV